MINTTFYLRRLHSICGIVPIGLFLLEHVITNASVIGGPAPFNAAVGRLAAIPHEIMIPLEICGVAIPFLFHGIYGAYIALQAKNNPGSYGYARNWQFALQRWTAWFLAAFLIWHVVYLRIMVKGGGTPISYELLQSYFSNPIVFVLYTIGMIAAIFHFCNGLSTFCMTWGIAKGPRIQSVITKGCLGLCALLSLVTLIFMSTYLM
ncbi:MAG: succinate dehydrogenase [Selenomonadaceae bacterium]|jgi:succinate dehydrogenase / fumarate reductase cytochrome b subunit